ncbi:helix-turn-helix transcriptional regulator [Prauserella cavernicola]|uniref:Helix-turn-helix transcriptional regulator n=1 Tax=Prauserella cavernicola TaxID=2800127 RepID=A0A934QSZ1_9PSEU|nr:helix-turn-helix transcriptional regulator [Prauserella cavernicola]
MRSTSVDGTAIRRSRELAGFTQDELARKLSVDRSAVGHWEAGRQSPSPGNFKALCRVLRVKRESLLAAVHDRAA